MSAPITDLLQRIPQWRGRTDLQVQPLSGGITNQNYRIEVGGKRFVLRLGGANTELLGIDRRNERAANRAAAAAKLAPEVLYFIEPEGYLLTRYIDGHPITPDEMRQPDTIRELAGILQRIHALPPIPGEFSPFRVVDVYHKRAVARGCDAWPPDFAELISRMRTVQAAFALDPAFPTPCHNDLLNENFIREAGAGRIVVLDWEYAGMGDSFFDLANLAAQHRYNDEQDELLVHSYFGALTPRRLARFKLMKPMSDFREAMWGLLQSCISQLAFDFRGYAATYFERLRAGFSDPRVDDWLAVLNQPG
jgi:thiamine kinase-like enzyme